MVSSSRESTQEQTNREARILTISRSNEIAWYTNARRDNVESRRNLLLTNCPSTFTTERYDKDGTNHCKLSIPISFEQMTSTSIAFSSQYE